MTTNGNGKTPAPAGKVHTRMPRDLHARLLKEADAQGVSLNQLIVALLAGGVGFKLTPTPARKPAAKRKPARKPKPKAKG